MEKKHSETSCRKHRRVLITEKKGENIGEILFDVSVMMSFSSEFNERFSAPSHDTINGCRKQPSAKESLCNTSMTPPSKNDFHSHVKCAMQKSSLRAGNTSQEGDVKGTFIKIMNDRNICEIKDVSRHESLSAKVLSSLPTTTNNKSFAMSSSKLFSLPHSSRRKHVKMTIKKDQGRNTCVFKENKGQLFVTREKVRRTPKRLSSSRVFTHVPSSAIKKQYCHPLSTALWKQARTMKKKVRRRNGFKIKTPSNDLSILSATSLSTQASLKSKRYRDLATNCALRKTSISKTLSNDGGQSPLHYSMPKSILKRYNGGAVCCPSFHTTNIQAFLQDQTYQPNVILVNCHKENGKCKREFSRHLEKKQQFRRGISYDNFGVSKSQPLLPDKTYQPNVVLIDCIKGYCVKPQNEVAEPLEKNLQFKGQTSRHSPVVSKKRVLSQDEIYQPYLCLVDCSKENDFNTKPQIIKPLEKRQFKGTSSRLKSGISRDQGASLDKIQQPYVCLVDCVRENDFNDMSQRVAPLEKKQLRELSSVRFSMPGDQAFSFDKTYQPYICLVDCSRENNIKAKHQLATPSEKKGLKRGIPSQPTCSDIPNSQVISLDKTRQPDPGSVDCCMENNIKAKHQLATPSEKKGLKRGIPSQPTCSDIPNSQVISLDKTRQPDPGSVDCCMEQRSAISLLDSTPCPKDQMNGISFKSEDCWNHLSGNPGCSFQSEESDDSMGSKNEEVFTGCPVKEELSNEESIHDFERTKYNTVSVGGYQDEFLSFLSDQRFIKPEVPFPKIEWF